MADDFRSRPSPSRRPMRSRLRRAQLRRQLDSRQQEIRQQHAPRRSLGQHRLPQRSSPDGANGRPYRRRYRPSSARRGPSFASSRAPAPGLIQPQLPGAPRSVRLNPRSVRLRQRLLVPSQSKSQPVRSRLVHPATLTRSRSTAPSFIAPQPHHASPAAVRSRLVLVWAGLILAMVGLLGNLVRLQVFEAAELQQMAHEQHGIAVKPFVPRRPIIDRQGNVIALDQQQYILYAHPMLFTDNTQVYKMDMAEKLAPILDMDAATILERLNLQDSGIKLKTALSEEGARQVRSLRADGLDLNPYQDRFYPKKSLFSHILGYVNVDGKGQVGIEYNQTELLNRETPTLNLKRTGSGALMPEGMPENFNYHEHLRLKLTVDSRLQLRIRQLLQQELERLTAERGVVIVMEVDTGAIRAMVTEPTYDPNALHTDADIPLMVNSAVSHVYEPGSTFKPINVAIALETGRLTPTDVVHDYGKVNYDNWSIENHDYEEEGARGDLTVTDVLKHSSNVGMIQIMNKLDPEQYYEWMENLGLGKLTGVDLPFEAIALAKSREQFTKSRVELATTAFGQGFSLTPIQLLQMQAALGNGGKLVTPYVVDGLVDHQDQRHWTPQRPAPKPVFTEATTRTVLSMMETVVNDGTGKAAQIPRYRIAGKTGTAQKAGDHGGYEEGAKVTSFVSLFPAEDPKFALLVLVDEPQGEHTYGGTVAAPIAHNIIESIITLENIPPTQD